MFRLLYQCIFQYYYRNNKSYVKFYLIVINVNGKSELFEIVNNIDFFIYLLDNFEVNICKCSEFECIIKFLFCLNNFLKVER